MKINKSTVGSNPSPRTHEGGVAVRLTPEMQLRRSVLSCLLWETEFYEDGEAIADRIARLVSECDPDFVAKLAIEARTRMHLRHVPLFIVREMARIPACRPLVRSTLTAVIQRADELSEFMAIYWKDGRQPILKQVMRGLADAFHKFSEYDLQKYNRHATVKLRDVMRVCHPKPKDAEQAAMWERLLKDELATPDTWEVAISAAKSSEEKTAQWTRLLAERRLGGLALLRNIRNMTEARVDSRLIKDSIQTMRTDRILPFRFVAAARVMPTFKPELETAMFKCLESAPKLKGRTCLLVDVSGSMDQKLSGKSDLCRLDAACALAMLLREICDDVHIETFSSNTVVVPPRRGFALRDAITSSQPHVGTYLGRAVQRANQTIEHQRLIVITDEQASDTVPMPRASQAYMINVASAKNGVGYGPWLHLDGFSEAIVDYIRDLEQYCELVQAA